MTFQDAKEINARFEDKHLVGAIKHFIKGCYVGGVGLTEWEVAGSKGNFEDFEKMLREKGRDPEAFCLVIYLVRGKSKLPKKFSLPKVYDGLPVYVLPYEDKGPTVARPAFPGRGE